jgi:thioredoxin reductase (NADPH)
VNQDYEVAIIGAGPAGLTAGLYAARASRRTVCFEPRISGGQIALTSLIENYPGFPVGVNGPELGELMEEQAVRQGMELRKEHVSSVSREGKRYRLETGNGPVTASAVIATAGANYRRLGVAGEERLTGRGVSYCATCDAPFFRNQVVAVVGGGDSAVDEGLFVARYASKIYLIHRRDQLRATRVLQERIFAEPKFTFVWDSVVESIEGDAEVDELQIKNLRSGERSVLGVAGVFIFIGQDPNSGVLENLVERDTGGHVRTDLWMRTSSPGLFAAGDIRADSSRQLVSAAGDGATAAIAADHYLAEHFPRPGAE